MPMGIRTAAEYAWNKINITTPKNGISRNAAQKLIEGDVLNLGLITLPDMDDSTRDQFEEAFGSRPPPRQESWVRLNKDWRQVLDAADPGAKEADYVV